MLAVWTRALRAFSKIVISCFTEKKYNLGLEYLCGKFFCFHDYFQNVMFFLVVGRYRR